MPKKSHPYFNRSSLIFQKGSYAKNIHYGIEKLKIPKRYLSNFLGVNANDITKWLKESYETRLPWVIKFAQLFRTSINSVIGIEKFELNNYYDYVPLISDGVYDLYLKPGIPNRVKATLKSLYGINADENIEMAYYIEFGIDNVLFVTGNVLHISYRADYSKYSYFLVYYQNKCEVALKVEDKKYNILNNNIIVPINKVIIIGAIVDVIFPH